MSPQMPGFLSFFFFDRVCRGKTVITLIRGREPPVAWRHASIAYGLRWRRSNNTTITTWRNGSRRRRVPQPDSQASCNEHESCFRVETAGVPNACPSLHCPSPPCLSISLICTLPSVSLTFYPSLCLSLSACVFFFFRSHSSLIQWKFAVVWLPDGKIFVSLHWKCAAETQPNVSSPGSLHALNKEHHPSRRS